MCDTRGLPDPPSPAFYLRLPHQPAASNEAAECPNHPNHPSDRSSKAERLITSTVGTKGAACQPTGHRCTLYPNSMPSCIPTASYASYATYASFTQGNATLTGTSWNPRLEKCSHWPQGCYNHVPWIARVRKLISWTQGPLNPVPRRT